MEYKPNINSKKWKSIKTIKEWVDSFKETEKGKSAHSTAVFFSRPEIDAEKQIIKWISPIFSKEDQPIILEKFTPEKSSKFDDYKKPRMQDVGIIGKTITGKSIFIGIEAKVNEPFGQTVAQALNSIKNNNNSNIPERINRLKNKFFSDVDAKNYKSIRYQLLYAAAGTISENMDYNILIFITFKNIQSTESSIMRNKRELKYFLDQIKCEPLAQTDNIYKAVINKKILYIVVMTI